MSRVDLDLKLSAAVALLAMLFATTVDTAAVRTLPALFLLLFVPGYALSVVLFPARKDVLERSLLAVGLSLCVDVLGGLLLDRLGIGLTARSWSVGLALFTLASCAAARRRRAAAGTASPDVKAPAAVRLGGRGSLVTAAMIVGSIAAVAGALVVARLPAGSAHVDGYSALWIKPVNRAAGTFSVGVRSQELRTMRFKLVALSLAGPRLVFRKDLTLKPGQEWTVAGRVGLPRRGATQVRVSLYRAGHPRAPYRQVYATFGSTAP